MPMWVEDEHAGYTRLKVSAAEKASQHAHAKGADEDVDDPGDDDNEPLQTGSDQRSPQKCTHLRAFQAGEADEDKPRAGQAPKPKKPKTQAAAEPKQTTLMRPQGVKRTLSLPDPRIAVGSTPRSIKLAAGIGEEKEALTGVAVIFCLICCLALRGLVFQIRQFAISALFSEASSGDHDYADPKATVTIARPRILKASRLDAQNVLILSILFLLVSECSEAVCNCSEIRCCTSRIALGLAIRIGKWCHFTAFLKPEAYKVNLSDRPKKHAEENNKKQGFPVGEPPKCSAFQRKVGKMTKIVTAFLEENDAFSWVVGPKN